jgi:ectoine hydroxylase-related dioxygenase (phytanoyl-CoA dioxygenase family)
VVNTLFWKPPGEPETVVAYHQDCEFRRPREHFRNLAGSYVQLGVALDPHGPENGGMRVIPESQRMRELKRKRDTSVLREAPDPTRFVDCGLEHFEECDVRMEPGDVLIWNAYLLHGSPTNTSPKLDRRFFVSAYMRAADCDAGEVVFANRAVASGS